MNGSEELKKLYPNAWAHRFDIKHSKIADKVMYLLSDYQLSEEDLQIVFDIVKRKTEPVITSLKG